MAEATLLMTKPGALTCSEALAVGLPLVLYDAIPGHEEENAAYLVNRGAALKAENAAAITPLVSELFSNQEKLAQMRLQAEGLGRPGAAGVVADTVQSLLSRSEGLRQRIG